MAVGDKRKCDRRCQKDRRAKAAPEHKPERRKASRRSGTERRSASGALH